MKGTATGGGEARRTTGKVVLIPMFAGLALAVVGGASVFLLGSGNGCSSTTGSLKAAGKPLGDFTLTPTQCRSGQRAHFFGVVLLPGGPNLGGIKIIEDPVAGTTVQVELPGSCEGPDQQDCEVVTLDPDACATLRATIRRTNTRVNDIVLLDGSLSVNCSFDEGSVKGDISFESCD